MRISNIGIQGLWVGPLTCNSRPAMYRMAIEDFRCPYATLRPGARCNSTAIRRPHVHIAPYRACHMKLSGAMNSCPNQAGAWPPAAWVSNHSTHAGNSDTFPRSKIPLRFTQVGGVGSDRDSEYQSVPGPQCMSLTSPRFTLRPGCFRLRPFA